MRVHGCVCVCVFVSSCQATKVLISVYLATQRVVVSVCGVNGSERQLLTSLIHAPYLGSTRPCISWTQLTLYLSICCKFYNKPGRKQEIVHEYHYNPLSASFI